MLIEIRKSKRKFRHSTVTNLKASSNFLLPTRKESPNYKLEKRQGRGGWLPQNSNKKMKVQKPSNLVQLYLKKSRGSNQQNHFFWLTSGGWFLIRHVFPRRKIWAILPVFCYFRNLNPPILIIMFEVSVSWKVGLDPWWC